MEASVSANPPVAPRAGCMRVPRGSVSSDLDEVYVRVVRQRVLVLETTPDPTLAQRSTIGIVPQARKYLDEGMRSRDILIARNSWRGTLS